MPVKHANPNETKSNKMDRSQRSLVQKINLLEQQIVLIPTNFPFENHIAWIQAFAYILAKSPKFSLQEIETHADMTLVNMYFEQTVFILHICNITESIWLDPTNQEQNQINSALKELKDLFCQN